MINNFLSAELIIYNPIFLWIIFGLICFSIEFFITPIGIMFLGLGAFSNAIFIAFNSISNDYNFISFSILSFFWFIVFWKYYKKLDIAIDNNFNIVGDKVQVYSQILTKNSLGKVIWSGTIMNAQLDSSHEDALLNETLLVQRIEGNILICKKIK